MNITFTWAHNSGRDEPRSQSDFLNQDGISLVDCVLMDSGGMPYMDTIEWLEKGIQMINSVVMGEAEDLDWACEAWGVVFSGNSAKIYSLNDEDYFQTIRLDVFRKILQAWIDFLNSEPDERSSRVLEFSIDE